MVIIYAATLGFWYLKNQLWATAFSIIVGFVLAIFKTKKIVYATLGLGILINYRATNFEYNQTIVYLIVGTLLPLAAISVFTNKFNFKDLILWAFLFYLGANLLSLITIPKHLLADGIVGVLQTLAFVFIYAYFRNHQEEGDQEYIAKSFSLFGLTIFLEFLLYVLSFKGTYDWGKTLELGWGVTNSIAMVILLIFPIIVYHLLKHPKHLYMTALIVALLTLLILTLSKAAYVALALLIIPFMLSTFLSRKTKEQKRLYGLSLVLTLVLSVVAYFIASSQEQLVKEFKDYILWMDERGWFNDVARLEIYQYAWTLFKQNPLFGTGSYTAGYYLTLEFDAPLLKHYHSFVMQTLATVGSVGFLTFIFLILAIAKKALSHSLFNICVFFSLLAMIIHGLMDNTFHNPLIMLIVAFLAALLEEAPPLSIKTLFRKNPKEVRKNPD